VPDTLGAWLDYVERLHHRPVDMGLDRVRAVAARMGLVLPAVRFVVGGTNGKGSTCAMLEAILGAAGYRVGRYQSPHLLQFNERARIDGAAASDAALVAQFERVEAARAATTLTYFEFTTLAVLAWFAQERVDVAVLEVGLGGRLDAVNIIDADCAIVTTIGLDHMDLLGPTREHIGAEKAHIYRAGRPAICADPDPPAALIEYAEQIGAQLWCIGKDFAVEPLTGAEGRRQWVYRGRSSARMALAWPALRGAHQLRNAAGALAALEAMRERLPVDQHAIRTGLARVQLAGRFQVIPGQPSIILDVAHNAHAAQALAVALRAHAASGERTGRTHAVFGMLRDKDAPAVVAALAGAIDYWHLVPTEGARSRTAKELDATAFDLAANVQRSHHRCVAEALAAARMQAGPDDRIIVFGSFGIVADALRWLERGSQ